MLRIHVIGNGEIQIESFDVHEASPMAASVLGRCNSDCTYSFPVGTSVIVLPTYQHQISSWGGVCRQSISDKFCVVHLNTSSDVDAIFPEIPKKLNVTWQTKLPETVKKNTLKDKKIRPDAPISVELNSDTHIVDHAPSNAEFLSDKNRDVAEQTQNKQRTMTDKLLAMRQDWQQPSSLMTPNLSITYDDYARIIGKKALEKEKQNTLERKNSSSWTGALSQSLSAIENFIPSVRSGNQDALRTRADPFALYIARMHRKIHSLWGYGFLVVLSEKNADDPLNNMNLMSKIEIVLNPNGSVDKAGIVVSSGEFLFDVAAASVINAAAPFLPTPQVLRSYDNKVYLHWRFYRGNRQCGTFGVDKFILNGS